MATNQISGRILQVGEPQSIQTKSGTPFTKRELVLDTTRHDMWTGERSQYDNYAVLEFTQDNARLLDGLRTGDVVTVDFTVEGRKTQDRQTGETRYYNTLRGYKVAMLRQGIQASPSMQSPGYASDVPPQYANAAPRQRPAPQPAQGNDQLPF